MTRINNDKLLRNTFNNKKFGLEISILLKMSYHRYAPLLPKSNNPVNPVVYHLFSNTTLRNYL